MVKAKTMVTAALACSALAGIQAPAAAQQAPQGQSAQATNAALLDALLARRAQIAASPGDPDSKRHALQFLDKQILKARSDLAALNRSTQQ